MKGYFACFFYIAFAMLNTVTGSRHGWYSEHSRGLRQDLSNDYYAPFGGDLDQSSEGSWSVPLKKKVTAYHDVLEEEEFVGASKVFEASGKDPKRKDKPSEKKSDSVSGNSPHFHLNGIVGIMALVIVVAGVVVARKRRYDTFTKASINSLEETFLSIEEDEFDKILDSFRAENEQNDLVSHIHMEDFRPPCLDPSNYDPEWSCSLVCNGNTYFKVIGNYMIEDGEIVGVSIYQSGKLSALHDFSSAQLLDENDPSFSSIFNIVEQKIRGKILCLQYQEEGPRGVAFSDVSESDKDFAPGVWYDISVEDPKKK